MMKVQSQERYGEQACMEKEVMVALLVKNNLRA